MIKEKIVDSINEKFDDDFEVIDIFHNTAPSDGKLRFCGYRHLSKMYDFYEVEFKFSKRVLDYLALHKRIKGLYYLANTKDKDRVRLFTTDKALVNRIKLYGEDFTKVANSYKR